VVFAPNGGATFVVHINPSITTARLRTPMPAVDPDGRLAAPWRWGGHHVDVDARLVRFTFVNRLNETRWTEVVSFDSAQGQH
jgi:hypothetical protein